MPSFSVTSLLSMFLTLAIFATLIPWIYFQMNMYPVTATMIEQYNFELYIPSQATYNFNYANCNLILSST